MLTHLAVQLGQEVPAAAEQNRQQQQQQQHAVLRDAASKAGE
jgi:hypothetical protein